MDAHRFDAFVKALSLSAARRGMVAALLGGTLISLLADLESEARPHTDRRKRRHDDRSTGDVSAEKRKGKKKKKKKKGKPPAGDEAPPCTMESCPIPPGCSAQVLDDCTSALFEALLADVEPCRPSCEDDANSAACQECLEPIVAALLPEAEACAVESCSSSPRSAAADAAPASAVARHRGKQRVGQVTAEAWWTRTCDNPTCCFADLRACEEDARDELFLCLGGAVVSVAVSGPGAFLVLAGCMAKLVYDMKKCQARDGCVDPEYGLCGVGDICCVPGVDGPPCNGMCCPHGLSCCGNGDTCCDDRTGSDHYCCGSKCCRREASVCDATGNPSGCCLPGSKPCHGTCCTDSPQVLCCDKFNGQTYCYAAHAGCPA